MRLLLFHADNFACRPAQRAGKTAGRVPEPLERNECLVAFLAAEEGDQEKVEAVVRELVQHARKLGVADVVLHSFAHLFAPEPLSTPMAGEVLERLAQRLGEEGLRTGSTPFGWRNSWELAVQGHRDSKVSLII